MYSKHKFKFKLYDTKRWVRRAKAQLAFHPLCAYCLQQGLVVPATCADHIEPHKGDAHAFFYGALQSLCDACHSGLKQQEEEHGFNRAIGLDGYPVDERHPFNSVS
jgi:5-methylcytosine-specific restriction protein A